MLNDNALIGVRHLLLVTIALGYAALCLMSGLDRASRHTPTLERLVSGPFRANADIAAARIALAAQDVPTALATAEENVISIPVSSEAAGLLGTARLLGGDVNGGDAAFRVAAAFGWRDVPTQIYWAENSAAAGEWDLAAARIDAILRANHRFDEFSALLRVFASDPAGRSVMATLMAENPVWLDAFFRIRPKVDPDGVAARVTLLQEVAAQGTPFGCKRVEPFVRALLQAGRRGEAVTIWQGHCPEAGGGDEIVDPAFENLTPSVSDPFGWNLRHSGDVVLRLGSPGKAGLIAENKSAAARLIASQPVSLRPGVRMIEWTAVETDGIPSERVDVSVDCGRPVRPPLSGVSRREITVPECHDAVLSLWLGRGSDPVRIERVFVQP